MITMDGDGVDDGSGGVVVVILIIFDTGITNRVYMWSREQEAERRKGMSEEDGRDERGTWKEGGAAC